jgi:glycosyltransferase involved in cell wall biosynthesis
MSDGAPARSLAVNGRFLGAAVTGVERYARGLLAAVRALELASLVVIVPPDVVGSARLLDEDSSLGPKWTGAKGHAWEQLRLPRLFDRTDGRALLSLCNWGPLAVRDQLVVIHDVAPYTAGSTFSAPYRAWAKLFARRLSRGPQMIGTVSEFSRAMIVGQLEVAESRVVVIPPGIGPPFDSAIPNVDRPGEYGLFVGGHIARKNVEFAVDAWSPIAREFGLPLHVVLRTSASAALQTTASTHLGAAHVVMHEDVDDDELVELYRRAACVVSPSLHEGFGLPLLEGMAVGTPFLSSATGAAEELAVQSDQVLPLELDAWRPRIAALLRSDQTPLREASLEAARRFTWERSARTLVETIEARFG